MISLEQIGPENWRVELSVRDDQKDFVSPPTRLLARAWAYRNYNSRAFIKNFSGGNPLFLKGGRSHFLLS